jgi:hypothetical protein
MTQHRQNDYEKEFCTDSHFLWQIGGISSISLMKNLSSKESPTHWYSKIGDRGGPDSKEDEIPSRLTLIPLALGVLLLASGCSNYATAMLSPGADLSRVKTFYVVHQPKDTHNIHYLIRDKLVKDGYRATAGPELPQSSYNVDSIVTYVDRWMWDITLYLRAHRNVQRCN